MGISMLRALLLMASLLAPGVVFAEAVGVDSRQEFAPLGCGNAATGETAGCHFTDADPALMVTIEGPSSVDVTPESVGFYTASIPENYASLMGAGINVALDAPNQTGCELEAFGPATKFDWFEPNDRSLLSHKYDGDAPPATLVGVWSYQFLVLNCQAPGALLLRVAMNAFDGNGAEDGELWNSNTLALTIPEPGALALGAVALATLALRRRA